MYELILAARALLCHHTPLLSNCGTYCAAACCQPDEEGRGGVYLFPGEEALYARCDWARVVPSDWIVDGASVSMLVCEGACPRYLRPLACRMFPLTPREHGGAFVARVDRRAFAMCPLATHGVRALDKAFVENAERAFALIAREDQGRAFLRAWQRLEDRYGDWR